MSHSFFINSKINLYYFSILLIFTVTIFSMNMHSQVWATPCQDCLINNSIQTLTIFIHQNENYPYLVGNATVLIYPNPLAHTINGTDVDPSIWGRGLFVVDDGPLDADLTPGVIELVGVNNGTYSVFEFKNPSSVMINDSPVFAEINGVPDSTSIFNYFLNATTTQSLTVPPPELSDVVINSLTNSGAKVSGLTILTSGDLPPSKIVSKNYIASTSSPTPILFTNTINYQTTASSLYTNLNIPIYNAPNSNSLENMAFMPPMFKGSDNNGNSLVMTPLLDKVTAGIELHLRLDNVGIGTTHPPLDDISIPLATDGQNVGIRVQVNDNIPSGFPSSPTTGSSLFLDVDAVGDLDLGNPSTFSSNPKIMFNVGLNSDGSCPTTNVYLYDSSANHWHPLSTSPARNPSADTTHTCGYIQSVEHFSSYLISGSSTSGTHDHSSGHSHGSSMSGMTGMDMGSDYYILSMITPQLAIEQIGYNTCGLNLVRVVVATTDDVKSIHVQIQGDKSGSSDAIYSSYQMYDQEYNSYHTDKRYVFESPLVKDETSFKVTVSDKQYALHKTVSMSNGLCFGTIDHFSINKNDVAFGAPLYDSYEILDQSAHMTMGSNNKMEEMNDSQNTPPQMKSDNNGLMTMNNHDNSMQGTNNMPSMNGPDNGISQDQDMMGMSNQPNSVVPEFGQMATVMLVSSIFGIFIIGRIKRI
jgi:hypothetical protein